MCVVLDPKKFPAYQEPAQLLNRTWTVKGHVSKYKDKPQIVADEAVRLAANRSPETLLWSPAAAQGRTDAVVFCYGEGK